jgi:hypothetical protein
MLLLVVDLSSFKHHAIRNKSRAKLFTIYAEVFLFLISLALLNELGSKKRLGRTNYVIAGS